MDSQPPPSGAKNAEHRSTIPPSLGTSIVENGIIAAAMRVFARRGFAAARVEDVLDEANIARRTFYRYFTSKEDVLSAAYELAMRELLRTIDVASERTEEPVAAARTAVDIYLDFHVENAALLRVLVEESVRSDSALADHRRHVRARVVQTLARATKRSGRVDDYMLVALFSALEGLVLTLIDAPPSAKDVARAKTAMHRLLEHALR